MVNNIKVSVIIVHYKNEGDLFDLLKSFYKHKPKLSFEIIIVDNSEDNKIRSKLKTFKEVKYLNSGRNLGYGGGINFGAKKALGEYIFVLNPDVIFTKDIISPIIKSFNTTTNIGIIAPLLYTTVGKIMDQGARELTPLRAMVKFSFLDKLWPSNPISNNFWVKKWNTKKIKQVDNVPGTAFIIKKRIFEEINGFDDKFFLYFEEFDLCDRVRNLKYKIYIDPSLKLIHKWETTTKLLPNKNEIFIKSRKYYFYKKFGLIKSILINLFLTFSFNNLVFLFILFLAALVKLHNLSTVLIQGLGDQGWFYLSARDLLIYHQIPLVGITSSHIWLHQGPLWTYILSVIFFVFKFNPIAPAIFTIFLDLITLSSIYILLTKMFNQKTGLLASVLYAFSPYIIFASRMPYHTSPIPLLILLFIFSVYKWIKGNPIYFPLSMLVAVLLYNFELQTVILFPVIIIFLIYGFFKKSDWFKAIINKKIIALSFVSLLLPMLPILIYDFQNGFPQTIVFTGWIFYKIISSIITSHSSSSSFALLPYMQDFIGKLYFVFSKEISSTLFVISFLYLIFVNIKAYFSKKLQLNYLLLLIASIFILLGIFINKTPSDAYLYSLIIPFVAIAAIFLEKLTLNKLIFYLILSLMFALAIFNISFVFNSGYYTRFISHNGYYNKEDAAKFVAQNSRGKEIKIIGKGEGSQFTSFTDYYEYLIWYFGGNVTKKGKIIYILYETPGGTKIIRRD